MKKELVVFVAGDFGDILYGCSIFKAIAENTGPVKLVYADRNAICKRIEERSQVIAPLLKSQPYIASFTKWDGEPVHWMAGDFRTFYNRTKSLAQSHLDHYKSIPGLPPIAPNFRDSWVTGIKKSAGRGDILVNRSPRYHNWLFPWKKIVERFGDRIRFIGLQEEHSAFCNEFGAVNYIGTPTLLHAAEAIAGSSLFIGNQSSCFAVAEGMKHPRILEVCSSRPDVIVAADQPNCQYCCDGSLKIDGVTFESPLDEMEVDTTWVPPKQWLWPELPAHTFFNIQQSALAQREQVDMPTARRMLIAYNVKMQPNFFKNPVKAQETQLFNQALVNAI